MFAKTSLYKKYFVYFCHFKEAHKCKILGLKFSVFFKQRRVILEKFSLVFYTEKPFLIINKRFQNNYCRKIIKNFKISFIEI